MNFNIKRRVISYYTSFVEICKSVFVDNKFFGIYNIYMFNNFLDKIFYSN